MLEVNPMRRVSLGEVQGVLNRMEDGQEEEGGLDDGEMEKQQEMEEQCERFFRG